MVFENYIHVSTQDEWDFVVEKLKRGKFNHFNVYKKTSVLNLNEGYYADLEYVKRHGHSLISFKNWLEETGYKINKKPYFEEEEDEFLQDLINKLN